MNTNKIGWVLAILLFIILSCYLLVGCAGSTIDTLTDGKMANPKSSFQQWYVAKWWNQQAEVISETYGTDCDGTIEVMIGQMRDKGLNPGVDYVAGYCEYWDAENKVWGNHMFLEMFKKYKIDLLHSSVKRRNEWIGEYK